MQRTRPLFLAFLGSLVMVACHKPANLLQDGGVVGSNVRATHAAASIVSAQGVLQAGTVSSPSIHTALRNDSVH